MQWFIPDLPEAVWQHQQVILSEPDKGEVFVWGYGILGKGPKLSESSTPEMIPPTLFGRSEFNPSAAVSRIKCGLNHFAAVTGEKLHQLRSYHSMKLHQQFILFYLNHVSLTVALQIEESSLFGERMWEAVWESAREMTSSSRGE